MTIKRGKYPQKKKKMTFTPSEGFLLSMFGGLSALLVSFCACILKSRCTRIKFGCVELERDVLNAAEFDRATNGSASFSPGSIVNTAQSHAESRRPSVVTTDIEQQ